MAKLLTFVVVLLQLFPATMQTVSKFDQLVEKMETDVLELRDEVERLYMTRCDVDSLTDCGRSNYDDCHSLFPNPTCPREGPDLRVKDYTISAIRIPNILKDGRNGLNPTDPKAIEAICFTQELDEYFQTKREQDREFWEELGAPTPQRYFGSNSGPIRIFPGRYSEFCDDYDPRVRPWFIAASSGPKNVLLLLDVSGSMETDDRISAMKDAAKVIVNTLTVTDRVALVPFSDSASVIADRWGNEQVMFQASKENKEKLVSAIDELEAAGPTNFLAAFDAAFEVFEHSNRLELTADCTTAVIFLTDGKMTHPVGVTEDDALQQINGRIEEMESKTKNPIFVFTYSVSYDDDLVHEFPKRLACSSRDGVWSRVNEADEIFDSLVGYSRLFALGLGEERNEDFTAWVEPYLFSSGIMGVTVSAPVYDRSKSPPLFLGVVGVDNTLDAFLEKLKEDGSDETFLTKIARRSAARCPRLDNIPDCVLESFRQQSRAGPAALCSNNCTDAFPNIEEQPCPAVSDYPKEFLDNYEQRGRSFQQKQEAICSRDDTSEQEDVSASNTKSPIGIGLGIGVGVVFVFVVGVGGLVHQRRRRAKKLGLHDKLEQQERSTASHATQLPNPVPPPTAPIWTGDVEVHTRGAQQ